MPFTARWMKREIIILNEVGQKEKDKYHMISLICGIQNMTQIDLTMAAQTVKNLPATQETWIRSLGWEDTGRRAWQPTAVFMPGESPWTEEPGGLSPKSQRLHGSQRVRHN